MINRDKRNRAERKKKDEAEGNAMNVQPRREVFEGLSDPLTKPRYRQPLGRMLTMVFLALVRGKHGAQGIAARVNDQR